MNRQILQEAAEEYQDKLFPKDEIEVSKFCTCNYPLIRSGENGQEYCGFCEKDINLKVN